MSQKIQICEHCGQPTGKCEDDALFLYDNGPFCEECYDAEASLLAALNIGRQSKAIKDLSTEAILSALAARPTTETLPLVKQWLAGEGMVVIETYVSKSIDAGADVCALKCKARHDGATETECALDYALPDDGGDYMHPDPSQCPAMLKRAKEGK